jgi:hypothetical protein
MPVLKNQKHEKFAQRIALGEAAGAAYRKVYQAKAVAAEAAGSRLLRNVKVSARVAEIQGKAADETVLSLIERRRFLADVVRTPIEKIDESSPLAQSYEFTTIPGDEARTLHKIKVPDKLKAIELDSRLAGDFKEKVEVTADGLLTLLEMVRGGKKQ